MDEPAYELPLAPAAGDGFLAEADVRGSGAEALPPGARVVVRLTETADFSGPAVSLLARLLAGCRVEHRATDRLSYPALAGWVRAYEDARSRHLAAELRRVSGQG